MCRRWCSIVVLCGSIISYDQANQSSSRDSSLPFYPPQSSTAESDHFSAITADAPTPLKGFDADLTPVAARMARLARTTACTAIAPVSVGMDTVAVTGFLGSTLQWYHRVGA